MPKLLLRLAAGLALLAAVFWYADPLAIAAQLEGVDRTFFAIGLASSIVSNVISAARWAAIARALGIAASLPRAAAMYFRGMTMNVLLPGATVSGDVLRGYQLARRHEGAGLRAAASVALDRLSGLWILCAMSLLSLLVAVARELLVPDKAILVYLLGLAAALALPWLPLPVRRLEELRRQALGARGPLLASAWLSALVQVFSAGALWCFAFAAGINLSYAVMLAAAAPVFVMGALPLGWGGFGAREAAAVVVLGTIGVPADQATAAALLYGISALLQGVLAAPLFLVRS
ncbi:MAG TPA: lysylphosphatidylglycerol synthase transmembrane domain-containing protein [Burkholderiales bacterium]|nr:lysylphosphatidylglycerol synthase transmembrane domain-containing protein [Burkholderiales bacterium]